MIYFFYILIYNALVEKNIYLLTYPLATSFFLWWPKTFWIYQGNNLQYISVKEKLVY